MNNAFYSRYLPAQVEEIIDFVPEKDKELTTQYLQSICNYVAWQTVCQALPIAEARVFFEKQKTEDPEILFHWLKDRIPELESILIEVLERSMKAVYKELHPQE